jgi:hypothetical protein
VFVVGSANLTGKATVAILLGAQWRIKKIFAPETGPFVYSARKDSTLHRLE